ncbi:MAG: O-antigen ligase family protein [Pseudomonadota bacterium]|nr:O-antigen ligase family protein [Pseudomonadota bacterium]
MFLADKFGRPYELLSKAVLYSFVFLAGMAFAAIHLDAAPAQYQLSYLVWLLPLIILLEPRVQLARPEKLFLLSGVLMFLSTVLSFWMSGDLADPQSIRTHWLYLLPVGLVATFSRTGVSRQWLYSLLIIAAIMSFIVVIKDNLYGGARGSHHGSPIPFGTVSLSTALLCLIFAMDRSVSKWLRLLLLASALIGLVAVIWSKTRAAWLFFVIWSVIAMIIWVKFEPSFKRQAAIVVSFFIIMIALLLSPFSGMVKQRFSGTYDQIEKYISGENVKTSSGQRIELWKVAINTFRENPLLGAGRSGFLEEKQGMNDNGEVEVIRSLQHAHNDVLWILATRGLLGLMVFAGLFIFLIGFYKRNLKDPGTRLAAYAGLTVCAGALVYGLTDIFMSLKLTIGYFMMINALLIRFIISLKNADAPAAGG